MEVNIAADWKPFLQELFEMPEFIKTAQSLKDYKAKGKEFYPKGEQIFAAFDQCPYQMVKVVILGQDPYHGLGQANGLCFSVNKGISIPPSLKNIFKEINLDTGLPIPSHGDLSNWAQEGVLLLNSVLTVFPNEAGSHQHLGWQHFTDQVIEKLSQTKEHLVFMLWGAFAQQKINLIDTRKHLVLKSVHPSPLSAHRGFFNNKHFSKTNAYLVEHHKHAVDWRTE